jgi:hypothetical protein
MKVYGNVVLRRVFGPERKEKRNDRENCIMRIYLSLHTNKCTSIIYYLKSVLIKIKTLYHL